MTLRINMWSSPRNLSTALMYSWRQRHDTTVVDEPLYAHYLRVTGRNHPGASEVLAAQINDGSRVVTEQLCGDWDTPVVFFKQMAKHLIELDRSFLAGFRNVLLTRDPHDMLSSLQRQIPDATIEDTGLTELVEILDWVLDAGDEPIVVDSTLLLQDPQAVLSELCRRMELPFDHAMLAWPAGPKPEDGVWAPYWYDSVRASIGFTAQRQVARELTPAVAPVLEQALPLYERLRPWCIGG